MKYLTKGCAFLVVLGKIANQRHFVTSVSFNLWRAI